MTTREYNGFMEMVIAECPNCGRWFFSWSEEDVTEKYNAHRCPQDWSREELDFRLERILRGAEDV